MINATNKTTEDMIIKLQSLKDKTKLKFYRNTSNYYDEMNIKNLKFEDAFSKNAQGIGKSYHQVLLLMKFPQTEPQVENMHITYYDLYLTVIKNRDEKETLNYEFDYVKFNDLITPNH